MAPNTKLNLLFCAFFAVTIPAKGFAQSVDNSGLKDAVVLIIRHAEDLDDGRGLSATGSARARAYAGFFQNFTISGQPLKLTYLFAAQDSANSQRPRMTLEPTGQAFGIAVDTRFRNKEFLGLVHEIQSLPSGQNILICWHHGRIPDLLRALGADPGALLPNGKWPGKVFDWLIQLRYDAAGHLLESTRINEKLSSFEGRELVLILRLGGVDARSATTPF